MRRAAFAVIALVLALFSSASWGQEKAFSCRGMRHGHVFLVWNESPGAPRIILSSLLFAKYSDGIEYQVINAESKRLTSGTLDPGAKLEIKDLAPSPRYLVLAEPGFNGVAFSADRPYGIMASPTREFGPNAPRGFLYFYVPPECKAFTLVVCCRSPKEGARLVVHQPDGSPAGQLDGELNDETPLKVAVPEGAGDAVWSLEFLDPTAPGTFLDDVSLHLEGDLPPLLCPDRPWAGKIGKETWHIDRASR